MCDYCENPLKWRIDENNHLIVSLASPDEPTPVIPGWEAYEENITPYRARDAGDPVAVTIKYLQPVEAYFICAYQASREYMGPEEGGWGHEFRKLIDPIVWVVGSRRLAECSCRALNRLAQANGTAPGPYQWGTSGIVFSVDRYPGEDDTSMDPRPHYC